MSVRVVVADDQALLRAGLCGIIDTAPDLKVVGEAGTGREAVQAAASQRPDVMLMDIRMPDIYGIEATRLITASSDTKVVILTTFNLDEYVYAALRAGANGFLLKDTPAKDLLDAIRIVAAGEALLAPAVTKRLIRQFSTRPSVPALSDARLPESITDRERDVLALIASGLSNNEIADHLGIGPGTVKTHIRHLLHKLGARDRVQLVIIAFQTGLTPSLG